MLDCWDAVPEKRPTFKEICGTIKRLEMHNQVNAIRHGIKDTDIPLRLLFTTNQCSAFSFSSQFLKFEENWRSLYKPLVIYLLCDCNTLVFFQDYINLKAYDGSLYENIERMWGLSESQQGHSLDCQGWCCSAFPQLIPSLRYGNCLPECQS